MTPPTSTKKLSSQATGIAAATVLLALATAIGLYSTLQRSERRAGWVLHTHEVIDAAQMLGRGASDAQNAMRGYLLTGDRSFMRPFADGSDAVRNAVAPLSMLLSDNPGQLARVGEIRAAFEDWHRDVATPLASRRAAGVVDPRDGALLESGKVRMDALRARVDELIAEERRHLEARREQSLRASRLVHAASLLALVLVAVLGAGAALALAFRITRAVAALSASAASIAAGDLSRRVPVHGHDELGTLASLFNDMVARLDARQRDEAVLKRMREMLHAAHSADEARSVLAKLAPRCVPAPSARLFLMNPSRNLLTVGGGWGEGLDDEPFSPEDCWSLRTGRPHAVSDSSGDVRCAHAASGRPTVCLPLVAQGETIGVLHLDSNDGAVPPLAGEVGEMLALTLANLRLREVMRNQAMRDPLTGLFNRRYLEETFQRELARAVRAGGPLSVVVLDVDHFKDFNDTHGHDGGDALLKHVGAVLRRGFREADVVCRYGGEEFVALLPDCELHDAVNRANAVRAAIGQLSVQHEGRVLGGVTLSAGVAAFPLHGNEPAALFQSADRALYRSKSDGRDRVTAAPVPASGAVRAA